VFDAESLLREAERRSPTVRALVASLERSDVIAYIQVSPSLPNRTGCLTFLVATESARLVRISIDLRNRVDDQIKHLGHELAHAIEVSRAPEVRDEQGMRQLYERIGWRVHGGPDFETDGAVETGWRVEVDLSKR